MPNAAKKYHSFDYYSRVIMAGGVSQLWATLFLYPFDVMITRLACDLTPKDKMRLHTTVFETFNKNHVAGGWKQIYQGFEIACFSAFVRGLLTLPIYEMTKNVNWFDNKQYLESPLTAWLYHFGQSMGPAALTAMCTSVLMYELDTVKKHY